MRKPLARRRTYRSADQGRATDRSRVNRAAPHLAGRRLEWRPAVRPLPGLVGAVGLEAGGEPVEHLAGELLDDADLDAVTVGADGVEHLKAVE